MAKCVVVVVVAVLACAMAGCLDWTVSGSLRLKVDGYHVDVAVTQPSVQ